VTKLVLITDQSATSLAIVPEWGSNLFAIKSIVAIRKFCNSLDSCFRQFLTGFDFLISFFSGCAEASLAVYHYHHHFICSVAVEK